MKTLSIKTKCALVAACLVFVASHAAPAGAASDPFAPGSGSRLVARSGCVVQGYGTVKVVYVSTGATTTRNGYYVQTLKNGSSGSCVKELQSIMNIFCMGTPLAVDGQYGSRTARAVAAYQQYFRSYGNSPAVDLDVNGRTVSVDGVAGPQTWVLITATSWSNMTDRLNCY